MEVLLRLVPVSMTKDTCCFWKLLTDNHGKRNGCQLLLLTGRFLWSLSLPYFSRSTVSSAVSVKQSSPCDLYVRHRLIFQLLPTWALNNTIIKYCKTYNLKCFLAELLINNMQGCFYFSVSYAVFMHNWSPVLLVHLWLWGSFVALSLWGHWPVQPVIMAERSDGVLVSQQTEAMWYVISQSLFFSMLPRLSGLNLKIESSLWEEVRLLIIAALYSIWTLWSWHLLLSSLES